MSGAQFQGAYITLLQRVRAKYPNATIFAMETFRRRFVPETQAAVRALNNAGDGRVRFINTEGWMTEATATVHIHPNDQGHRKIAGRLAPIIG
jgi:hypothetical protein